MLKALETRRSWVTQRLANRFPPYAKARQLAQSFFQQIAEPIGRDLQDIYWWVNYNLGNYILNTSDLFQLSDFYYLDLPPNFTFRYKDDGGGRLYLPPTNIRGQIEDTWVTLSQAENNSLEELWFNVPTRITQGDLSYPSNACLTATKVENLHLVTPVSPPFSCKVWISVTNNSVFRQLSKGVRVRSSVTIGGYDSHGKEAVEKLYFAFNGQLQTKRAWSEINYVITDFISNDAYISIDWLNSRSYEILDKESLYINPSREKFRFFSLGTRTYGSVLQHKTFSADDISLVMEGFDEKHIVNEVELLDTAGNNISTNGLTSWPKRRWIITNDDGKLHFFIPELKTPSLELLRDKSLETVLQIGIQKEWAVKGDYLTLDYNMTRPFVRVLRTRWTVIKPDNSKFCLDETGTEIPYSASAWTTQDYGTKFKKTGFQGNERSYLLDQTGQYTFYLESMITDSLTTEGQSRPITNVDVKIITTASDTATASVDLPVSIGEAASIAFDGFGRPWIINVVGVAHLLEFHFDYYLVDFRNKTILVREEYSNLEVEA